MLVLIACAFSACEKPTALAPTNAGAAGNIASTPDARASESVILIGVHTEPIGGYGPMFSDKARPNTDIRSGYRTLVFHVAEGSIRLAAELDYLALPLSSGFLYIGEASVRLHEPPDPSDTNEAGVTRPHDYNATALFRTTQRSSISEAKRALEERLGKGKSWGTESTVQIVYVTPKAMCTVSTNTEWTGGATWFQGQTTYELSTPLGKPIGSPLAKHVNDAQLLKFARETVASRGLDEQVSSIDEPFDAGFGRFVDFRSDVKTCLERHEGQVWLSGTVELPGNSAHSYSISAPVAPAPEALTGSQTTVDFAQIRRKWPKATGVVFSPSRDVVLVLENNRLSAFDARSSRIGPTFPLAKKRIVMVETAGANAAPRWLAELAP